MLILSTRAHRRAFFGALAALAGLIGLSWTYYTGPDFWAPTVLQNDARQQSYFFGEGAADTAFEGDLITDYMSSYLPPAYRGVMNAATTWTDAVTAGKLIHLFLFAVCVAAGWTLGFRAGGVPGGFAAALVLLCSGFLHDRLASGLPRSFSYPFLFIGLAGLAHRSWHWVGAAVAGSAALYPPTTMILLPCAAVALLEGGLKKAKEDRVVFLSAAFWGTLTLTALAVTWKNPEWIGRPVTLAEAFLMPEFGSRGRFLDEIAWFTPTGGPAVSQPFIKRLSLLDKGPIVAAMLSAALMPIVAFRARNLGPYFKDARLYATLLASCVFAYGVSYAFAFRLFFPDRAVLFGLLPLMWILAGVFPSALAGPFSATRSRAGLTALLSVLLVMAVSGTKIPRSWDHYQTPSGESHGFIAAVRRLPPNAIVAGAPIDMDWVPLLARRRTYLNYETSHPLFTGFNSELRRRYGVLASVYYATDRQSLRALASAEKITHVLVTKKHFGPEGFSPLCFEPHESMLKEFRRSSEGRWVLFPAPQEATLYESDHFALVELERL